MLSNQKPSGDTLGLGFNSFEASTSGTTEIKFVKSQKEMSPAGGPLNKVGPHMAEVAPKAIMGPPVCSPGTSLDPPWSNLELHLSGDKDLRDQGARVVTKEVYRVSIEGYKTSYARCRVWRGFGCHRGDKEVFVYLVGKYGDGDIGGCELQNSTSQINDLFISSRKVFVDRSFEQWFELVGGGGGYRIVTVL
ncbi:hypothetical protein Tco_1029017 [Tanacetum coccineum]|uniref:Uncharacterized protein n=1 Tax=Tanacetum coccineum TaxID=301880 RepID=A0ABQ5G2J4_9ASTR